MEEPKLLGMICPVTDGTCNKECGFKAHIVITRAKKNITSKFSIPVDPAEANICDGCE